MNARRFYTIMIDETYEGSQVAHPDNTCWVLQLEPETKERCKDQINWQHVGNNYQPMAVCEHVGNGVFKDANGNTYTPRRGIYTDKAWDAFQARLTAATV